MILPHRCWEFERDHSSPMSVLLAIPKTKLCVAPIRGYGLSHQVLLDSCRVLRTTVCLLHVPAASRAVVRFFAFLEILPDSLASRTARVDCEGAVPCYRVPCTVYLILVINRLTFFQVTAGCLTFLRLFHLQFSLIM